MPNHVPITVPMIVAMTVGTNPASSDSCPP
jgi:hypothetical protein